MLLEYSEAKMSFEKYIWFILFTKIKIKHLFRTLCKH